MKKTLIVFLTIAISACAPLPVTQNSTDRRDVPSAPDDSGDASPSATTGLLEQSRAQLAAGRYPQAGASIERALRIEPGNPYLWLELAQIHLAAGDVRQAEAHVRKALTLAGDDTVARRAAQRVLDQQADR